MCDERLIQKGAVQRFWRSAAPDLSLAWNNHARTHSSYVIKTREIYEDSWAQTHRKKQIKHRGAPLRLSDCISQFD
jgi:hypothetical protein